MNGLWEIISGWPGFGQAIFLFIVICGLFTLIRQIAYYISVSFKGWPPEGTPNFDEEDD